MIKLANFLFLKDITLAVKENIDYIKNVFLKKLANSVTTINIISNVIYNN